MERESELKKELKDIAPDFPQQRKEVPPSGYFDQLPDQILMKWKKEQVAVSKNFGLLRIATAAAAVMCLLFLGWLMTKEKSQNQKVENITPEEAYQYVHENIDEFEYLLQDVNLPITESELDLPQEDIEQYLIEETDQEVAEELF